MQRRKFLWHLVVICVHLQVSVDVVTYLVAQKDKPCRAIYVRWARAALDQTARVSGAYSLEDCERSCSTDRHPSNDQYAVECAAFNHKQGGSVFQNDCQLFRVDQLVDLDHDVIARDQYSFYKKYCIRSQKICKSMYHFDLVVDSYMEGSEVARILPAKTVEDCLAYCLDERTFTCRSVSYNRTGRSCMLSTQNRLSKPGYVRLNSNPNWRVDYFENNCYNDSFTFTHDCTDDGIRITVESKTPYTGVLYGLYDYFTCRMEPRHEVRFSYMFPLPSISSNCTDSITHQDGEIVLDVVLSTDGVEPLYFLTDQDVLYQARCKTPDNAPKPTSIGISVDIGAQTEKTFTTTDQSATRNFANTSTIAHTFTVSTANPILSTTDVATSTTGNAVSDHTLVSSDNSTSVGSTTTTTANFVVTASALLETASSTTTEPSTVIVQSSSSTDLSRVTTTLEQTTSTTVFPTTTVTFGEGSTSTLTSTSHNDASSSMTTVTVVVNSTAYSPPTDFSAKTQTDDKQTLAQTSATSSTTAEDKKPPVTLPVIDGAFVSSQKYVESAPPTSAEPFPSQSTTTTFTDLSSSTTSLLMRILLSDSTSTTPSFTTLPPYWWRITDNVTTSTTSTTTSTAETTPLTSSTERTTVTETTTTVPATTSTSFSTVETTTTTTPAPTSTTTLITRTTGTTTEPQSDVRFQVLYNGVPTTAVLIQSLITLSFAPGLPNVAAGQISLQYCRVEPSNSKYVFEPLVLVQQGCPADRVGLVYPVRLTQSGLAVEMEAFRYTDSAEILYSCTLRICQSVCPPISCVDADGSNYLSYGRRKRQLPFNTWLTPGFHFYEVQVQRRLVVVNNQYELQYYLRTGQVPTADTQSQFLG